jgi:hypothetical protein
VGGARGARAELALARGGVCADVGGGRAGLRKTEFFAGSAGRLVEQQREQPAILQSQQQRSNEREQQCWFPYCESPEISRMARFAAVGQSGGDRARLRDYPRVQRAAFSKSGRPRSGGPATASSAAKDVAGSAPPSFHRPQLCRSAPRRAGFSARRACGRRCRWC